MKVNGLVWLGITTSGFEETVRFFNKVLNVNIGKEVNEFALFRLPNGDKVEIFGPHDEDHSFFTSGPVVGFSVDDIRQARAEMEAAGVEFIGPIHASEHDSWTHFRGPDGNIFELTSRT
jgi:predicted enzyme related to lactoylglutathione lyase